MRFKNYDQFVINVKADIFINLFCPFDRKQVLILIEECLKFEKDEYFLFKCYKVFEENHPDTEKINFNKFYDHLKTQLKLN